MKGHIICPACKGNGFRYVIEDDKRIAIDCKACDNQGEVLNDEKTRLIFVILIILSTGCSQKRTDGSNLLMRIIMKGVTGGIDFR